MGSLLCNRKESHIRSNRVWLRGPDEVLNSLMAEENLFKEVEVAGLLRKDGIFDVGGVTLLG